jgi:hypothetical protein
VEKTPDVGPVLTDCGIAGNLSRTQAGILKITTVSFVLGLAIVVYMLPGTAVKRPAGVLAPGEPSQTSTAPKQWLRKSYRISALAAYYFQARVLLTDRYWLGRESDLSPIDLTFGWGQLSDSAVLEKFSIYRGHRCFYWKPRSMPIPLPQQEVISHTANVHIIPADDRVAEALFRLRKGDVARLGGYLVEVTAPDGWRWGTSLTREDSGPFACELMWVDWVRAD